MFSKELKELAEYYKDKKSTSNLTRWKKPIYYQLLEATDFLPDGASATQRLWHVREDSCVIPKCKCCDNNVSWIKEYKPSQYAKYCSTNCASRDEETKSNRKNTIKEKYGVEYFSQTDEFHNQQKGKKLSEETKNKMKIAADKRTDEEKQQAINKRRKTNLKRYGHINILASDKVKEIKKEKYGTESYVETDEFNEKRKKTMLSKYGVEYSGSSDKLLDKSKRTNLERYGSESWSNHHISVDVLDKLNNCDWLFEQHITNKMPSTEIAKQLRVDKETVGNYIKKAGFDRIRHPSSYPEQQICKMLDDYNINYISNDRKILNGKELDIYIPSHKLAIEYCGLYWHSSAQERMDKKYHINKLKLCNSKGLRLITIFEDEWVHNEQIVKNKLLNILKLDNSKSVFARKCNIVDVDNKHKQIFFNENHIQGDGPSSINIGLKYESNLVAVMGFIKQRNQHYLNRYATSTKVVGGFSKLLKYFQNNYEWNQVVSFADLRWSDGGLYNNSNWTLDKVLPPDYYYVNLSNQTRIHKFNFRHKNLKQILGDNYDHTKSELENTHNNNWFRIYNCGLQRWIIKKEC